MWKMFVQIGKDQEKVFYDLSTEEVLDMVEEWLDDDTVVIEIFPN